MIKLYNTLTENMTDQDWDLFRTWLKTILTTADTVRVTFTKQDGTERVMTCTLKEDLLPKREVTEGATPRKKSDSTLAVFDLENQGWRSFTIRNIKRVDFELDEDWGEAEAQYTGEPC